MPKAVWNGTVIAESDDTIVVEGNHYFPRDTLNEEFFAASDLQSRCPWKGTAGYFDVTVDGKLNPGRCRHHRAGGLLEGGPDRGVGGGAVSWGFATTERHDPDPNRRNRARGLRRACR